MFNHKDLEITEGTIWKQVLLFFIPIVIGAFFQHLYGIVDTIIVGRGIGTLALSAVGGSASKLITMIINFFLGVSVGITAYASRYAGKKDYRMIKSIAFNGLFSFSLIGIFVSAIGILFTPQFLSLLKTPPKTVELATIYLRTYLSGIVFCIIYNALAGILRAMGDAKRPLYVLIFTSLLNIVLDIVFALVMGLGVFGVAIATVLSQTVSAVILVKILMNALQDTEHYSPKIEPVVIKDIMVIGVPSGLQSMMYSLSNIVVQTGVNTFGALSVAAWVAYVRVDSIVDVFLSSLGGTVITFVGQNYGAGHMDRVYQSVRQIMIISYAMVLSLTLTFMVSRHFLLGLFTSNPEVVQVGASLMFVIMPMYLLSIPHRMLSQTLRGLGDSFVPMLLTLVGVVGLRILWVYLVLPFNRSLLVLGACYPASGFLMSVIFYIYYKYKIRFLSLPFEES